MKWPLAKKKIIIDFISSVIVLYSNQRIFITKKELNAIYNILLNNIKAVFCHGLYYIHMRNGWDSIGKTTTSILPGSAETKPKCICFSNSHLEVVIYSFKILTPLPPLRCGGLQYFKNTEWTHFHQRRPVCLPFLFTFVHLGLRRGRGRSQICKRAQLKRLKAQVLRDSVIFLEGQL